jgi:hypothetical protein
VNGLPADEQHCHAATIDDNLPSIRDNRATSGTYNGQQEAAWLAIPFPSLPRCAASPNQENVMKKLTIGLSIAALALAGTAYAAPGHWGDADNNGTLTRAEAQTHANEMFTRLDANKDGKLDAADREARRNAAFDRIDTNKDGQISRQEFAAERPDQAGRDQDHDGKHRMGHRGGGKGWGGPGGPGGPRGDMAQLADTNKDGAISQSEFSAAALQRFDSTDANKDGQVTKEERQTAFKSMRDQARSRSTPTPATPAN